MAIEAPRYYIEEVEEPDIGPDEVILANDYIERGLPLQRSVVHEAYTSDADSLEDEREHLRTLEAWGHAINNRDPYTIRHCATLERQRLKKAAEAAQDQSPTQS